MDTLFERLRAVDTTTLSDVGKQLRVMDAGLRPLRLGLKLVGRAVTVAAADDLMPVLDGLARAGGGDVLVVDGGGSARALAGELFGSEALRRSLAGIVIDGACRDTNQLRQLPLPFYARGLSPRAAGAKAVPGEPGAVRCGGVDVAPGDIVFGDDDGLVIAPSDRIAAALEGGEAIARAEHAMLTAMGDGRALHELTNYAEHAERLDSGEDSRLEFRVE
jgi:4-hydroxy-4-methyl-2-oxoglutarate aldolase